MSTPREYRYFMADFETTSYKGQEYTEVWASAAVEFWTEDVKIFHSIEETFKYFLTLGNAIIYYHNLKFDGSFWLSFLYNESGFKEALVKLDDGGFVYQWLKPSKMPNNSFCYTVSYLGQWYSIRIKHNNKMIELRDSLKLLPFSVKKIGESFKTKHKKLDMEYTGFRYAGCEITDKEKEYIANDVLVVKEALELLQEEGHVKPTIGSCCLEEFKSGYDKKKYQNLFPDLTKHPLSLREYGSTNMWQYIHKAYKGGWCYLVKGKEGKIKHNGTTADVNSLYPSMMSSESGNYYPVGLPTFWKGNIPILALIKHRYFFVRLRTRFKIKEGKLPFIQLKRTLLYNGNECLETSDYYDKTNNRYLKEWRIGDVYYDGKVELTLTCTDYVLFKEHYDLSETEYLDGCWFETEIGLFDDYIEKYKQIKLTSKGAKRELAKLFLNNLYGKMASSPDSSFKIAKVREDKALSFFPVIENNKKCGYIADGAAITSYARCFTIRAAQANYHGVNEPGFIYADTDSIHCDLPPDQIEGIKVHDKNFCCWKLETCWDIGYFARQKTYIEHVTHDNLEPIDKPYYNIKCAGMPDKCKFLFEHSISGEPIDEEIKSKLTEEEIEFASTKRSIEDFKIGLKVPGKLLPKRIEGGIVLTDTYYTMQ